MRNTEAYQAKVQRKLQERYRLLEAAAGREPADLVFKNVRYVNVFSGTLETCDIAVSEGRIAGLGSYHGRQEIDLKQKILCPGFLDAHIHLESSLISPAEFARAVIPHGTTTVVTDPHEITNVMGTQGIDYMLAATEGLPLDVRFMIPSCVPATPLDESGAVLGYEDIGPYLENPRVHGLAEVMNFTGVAAADPYTVAKIAAAHVAHKRIDGHAPDLAGRDLNAYIASGIYSDHECASLEDAMNKLKRGQYIMIREGTAARNLEALVDLLKDDCCCHRCMFCTDDKHPSDLLAKGHMDDICRRAVALGADPIRAVQASSLHGAQYFGLHNRGAIAPGYLADLVVLEDLVSFRVTDVYRKGRCVYSGGKVMDFQDPAIPSELKKAAGDTFHLPRIHIQDLQHQKPLAVLGMIPGQVVTEDAGFAETIDVSRDILKIAVAERHKNTGHIGLGFLKGYGIRRGAVATSVAHDSHNIICVGTNDGDMAFAMNRIAENRGGIVVARDKKVLSELPLDIGGLMSSRSLREVNARLEEAKAIAHAMGVGKGIDPFMTLSFMSLSVIPALRITTRGVFNVITQSYV